MSPAPDGQTFLYWKLNWAALDVTGHRFPEPRALLFQSFRARRWGTLGKEGRAASAPTESSDGTSAHAASEAYRASPKIERFQGEAESDIRTSTETGVPDWGTRRPAARSSPVAQFADSCISSRRVPAVSDRLSTRGRLGVGRTVPPPSPPRPAALKDAGPGMPPRHRTPFCHKTDETQRQLNSLAPVGLRESRFRRASLGVRSQSPSPAPREQRLPAPIVRDLLRVTVPPRTRAAAPGRDAERTASHHRSHSESKLVTPAHAWHRTHRTSPHTQPRHHPTCPAQDLQPPAPAWPPGFCKCSSLLRSLVII